MRLKLFAKEGARLGRAVENVRKRCFAKVAERRQHVAWGVSPRRNDRKRSKAPKGRQQPYSPPARRRGRAAFKSWQCRDLLLPAKLGEVERRRLGVREGGGLHSDACQCGLSYTKLSTEPPPERRRKAAFDLPHSKAAVEVSQCEAFT